MLGIVGIVSGFVTYSLLGVLTGPTSLPKSDSIDKISRSMKAREYQRDKRVLIPRVVTYL